MRLLSTSTILNKTPVLFVSLGSLPGWIIPRLLERRMIPPCEVRSQFTGPLPREWSVTPRIIVPAESLAIIGASGAARAWKKRFSTTSAPAPVSLDKKKNTPVPQM